MNEFLRYGILLLMSCFAVSVSELLGNSLQNNSFFVFESKQVKDSSNMNKSFYLPEWFSFTADTNQKYIRLLGISDPGLEEKQAFEQAYFRLKALLSLMIELELSSKTEHFSRFQEELLQMNHMNRKSKFIQLNTISSRQTIFPDQIIILDTATTVFGEKLVSALYLHMPIEDDNKEDVRLSIDIFEIEYGQQQDFSIDMLIWMQCRIHDDTASYKIYKQNEIYDISSTMNNMEFIFREDYYKYYNISDLKPELWEITTKLFYGLWKAFFENICMSVSRNILSETVMIKSVSENFGHGEIRANNNNSMIYITREIKRTNTAFTKKKIATGENMLWLDLDFDGKTRN